MIAGWAAIAGTIFLIATGIATLIKRQMERNKKYEDAENDVKKAIDKHDFNAILDGVRRMRHSR